MRCPENIREVEQAGADWIGFIFFSKSPRYVAEVPAYLPGQAKRIGVFVNEDESGIKERVKAFRLDYVQLHGHEQPDLCQKLQAQGIGVIKVFSLKSPEDVQQTLPYEGTADYFLFDTPCTGHGGSGKCFDWSLLDHYSGQTPFLLSGGLSPDSLEALSAFYHPRWAGIDLNSGFETAPALKDALAIRQFIKQFKTLPL